VTKPGSLPKLNLAGSWTNSAKSIDLNTVNTVTFNRMGTFLADSWKVLKRNKLEREY
jgi:hypothetical protein